MRGFSSMSDEERQQIKQQHSKPYDGYATNYVTSNMTPLTVYDAAQDKSGMTVNAKGEVKPYHNHNINETAAKNFHYDEIDDPYTFKSKGPMDPFREEEDKFDELEEESHNEFEEIDENEEWGDIENPKVGGTDITEEINRSLDMFKRFKKFN